MTETFQSIDDAVFLWINNGLSCPLLDAGMSLLSVIGEAWVWICFGLIFIVFRDATRWKRMAITFLIVMSVAGAALHVFKNVTERGRPLERFKADIDAGKITINTPLNKLYSRSFPSGHSQAAFSAATFFALYYGRRRGLLYTTAFLVAFSRIYVGAHFPSDIVFGSLLGWFVTWAIWGIDTRFFRR